MEEIWNAIKRLPACKVPGPDGSTPEFLRASWHTVKQDIVDVFQQLYDMRGQGFCRFNQVLLTLLPKRVDVVGFADCRSISLIHLVAKFAKTLSLRLASKLDGLVSSN